MSVRNGIVAALTASVLAGASLVAAATTPAAAQPASHQASSACGSSCTTISAEAFGSSLVMSGGGAYDGSNLYLIDANNVPDEDFKLVYLGTVAAIYSRGLASSTVDQYWPDNYGYEYVYAPGGADSGLCVATSSLGGPVILEQCAVSPSTVWIAMTSDLINAYEPLMTATNTVVNTPYVMTMAGEDSAVTTSELTLTQGTLSPEQMMRDINGVL